MDKSEVERLVKEAAAHADEDKKTRERIEARNHTESSIYQIEKMLKEAGDKLQGGDREKLDAALAEAKEALKSEDVERIKKADEDLKQAAYKLSEAMYAQTGAAPGGAEGGQSTDEGRKDAGDKVVDAEFD